MYLKASPMESTIFVEMKEGRVSCVKIIFRLFIRKSVLI